MIRRNLILYLVLIFIFALTGNAFADFIYTTENGTFGVIETTKLSSGDIVINLPNTYSGYSDDLFVSSYNNGENPAIILVEHNYSSSVSGDYAFMFNTNNLSKPFYEGYLAGVRGTSAILSANNGRSFYVASRANGALAEFSIVNGYTEEPRHYYLFPDENMMLETAVANSYYIYGLYRNAVSTDLQGTLKQFDGQLTEAASYISVDVSAYANDMAMTAFSEIYIGNEHGLDYFRYNSTTQIISQDEYGSINTMCSDESRGIYFISEMTSGDAIYHMDSSRNFEYLYSTADNSSYYKILYDNNLKVICAVMGGKIIFIDPYGNLLASYSANDLGGAVTCLAKISTSGGVTENSSSGCNGVLLNSGAILIFITSLIFLKRKFFDIFMVYNSHKRRGVLKFF